MVGWAVEAAVRCSLIDDGPGAGVAPTWGSSEDLQRIRPVERPRGDSDGKIDERCDRWRTDDLALRPRRR